MSNEQFLAEPKVEVRRTADGSATLFVPALNEHYHSQHGARQESAHVFIRHGLLPLLPAAAATGQPLRILEIGLGTGLNAWLTLEAAQAATGQGRPVMFIMDTKMGFGVDFMMEGHKWHGVAPNDAQLATALQQLAVGTVADY